jgi:rod shape determining protein RodA
MSTASFVPAQVARLPWTLIFVVLAIGIFGGMCLFSAAGGSMRPWALLHFVRFFALLGMAVAMSYVRPDTYRDFAWPAYGVVIVLLIVTLVVGTIGGGAKSWLELGVIRIQPSELMKPVSVLLLASFYGSLPPGEIRRFGAIWPPLAILAVPVGLIIMQPDLGTTLLLLFAAITVMFLAGLPLWYFIGRRIRSAPAITSRRARSRSAPAAFSARASSTALRAIFIICLNSIRISYFRQWRRNGASPAVCS